MLRVITDPEADLEQPTTAAAEPDLSQLLRGVLGLAWMIGPVAPRTVGRLETAAVRVEFVGGFAELVLRLRNEQAAAAPVLLVVAPLRAADGQLRVDPETPAGVYDAAIRLLGADEAVIPIVAEVSE